MMDGSSKIFVNGITNQLPNVLPSIVHLMWYELISKREVIHDILNVEMVGMDYVIHATRLRCGIQLCKLVFFCFMLVQVQPLLLAMVMSYVVWYV